MNNKVLFVDDDLEVLGTFHRQFRDDADITVETVESGSKGLMMIKERGPYAVIVSDQNMPVMDGTHFLAEARKLSPDSVRVMLTGNANLKTAVDAINEGRIFRFMVKPIPRDTMNITMKACIAQYHLITAEHELLTNTLNGVIEVMSELLNIANPAAFSQMMRVRSYVRFLADQMRLEDIWQFDMAALLSQIGCITLSQETLLKIHKGETLSSDENEGYKAHPEVAANLLGKIPRLEAVADMIRLQHQPFTSRIELSDTDRGNRGELGGQLLRIAIDFDQCVAKGSSVSQTIKDMLAKPTLYHSELVKLLASFTADVLLKDSKAVTIDSVEVGQVLENNVYSSNETLLATAGTELTETLLLRLRAFARTGDLKSMICNVRNSTHHVSPIM